MLRRWASPLRRWLLPLYKRINWCLLSHGHHRSIRKMWRTSCGLGGFLCFQSFRKVVHWRLCRFGLDLLYFRLCIVSWWSRLTFVFFSSTLTIGEPGLFVFDTSTISTSLSTSSFTTTLNLVDCGPADDILRSGCGCNDEAWTEGVFLSFLVGFASKDITSPPV